MTQTNGDKTANKLAMLGHLCTDINQGAMAACMPFLIANFGYSYTEVTALVFFANMISALIQPLFGTISDKHPMPWLMALGTLFAGVGMCGVGLSSALWATYLCATLSGCGIAMFHAEGGRVSNLAAGRRKSNGMSIFAVGGNIGFFVGPFLTAIFLNAFGMRGALVFLIPAIGGSVALFANNNRFVALGTGRETAGTGCAGAVAGPENKGSKDTAATQPEHWRNFWLVVGAISLRSVLATALMSFIPLFFTDVLGQSEMVSSLSLCVFSIAGALATILSGRVTERFGVHRTTIACLMFAVVACLVFAVNRSLVVAYACTFMLAISVDLFYPSQVALGMSYVPRHLGTASGFSYGVAVSVGGVAEPFLGMVGDAIGLPCVLVILAGVAIVGTAVCLYVRSEDYKLLREQQTGS